MNLDFQVKELQTVRWKFLALKHTFILNESEQLFEEFETELKVDYHESELGGAFLLFVEFQKYVQGFLAVPLLLVELDFV